MRGKKNQIMKIDESPRKSYEHARFFFTHTIICTKNIRAGALGSNFRAHVSILRWIPKGEIGGFYIFLLISPSKRIVFPITVSKSQSLIPKLR